MKNLLKKCINCGKKISAERTNEGIMKYKCSYCGTIVVSKQKGKRHLSWEIFMPRHKATK